MARTDLKVVQGKRSSSRKRRESPSTRRVIFIPREDGTIVCVEQDTYYAQRLLRPVAVTVEEGAVGYEKLE